MPKFKITFCDVIEADDKLNAYNKFRAYLKECVEMEDITAFGFQQESAEPTIKMKKDADEER